MLEKSGKINKTELYLKPMAGAPGFEPGNAGTKNRCLTAWLRPNKSNRSNRLRGLIAASFGKRNRLIAKSTLVYKLPVLAP